eukprot:499814_1
MSKEWKQLENPKTTKIRPESISIGNSIWWSTDYNEGERGMVEFDIKSNKIISTTPYPNDITPEFHCLCECGNIIYIVDGYLNNKIYSFDPKRIRFEVKIDIPVKVVVNLKCVKTHFN